MSIKLNLGCGANKIPGYINVDAEASTKPDLLLNFINNPLPYKDGKVEEVVLFHTIEHIPKGFHPGLISEISRVLKMGGTFYCSFPEFKIVAENWLKNKQGQRDWWEKVIFGRQLYPSDYHVCAMNSTQFRNLLSANGFNGFVIKSEEDAPYNTIIRAKKAFIPVTYEQLHVNEMKRYKIVHPGKK